MTDSINEEQRPKMTLNLKSEVMMILLREMKKKLEKGI